MVEGWYGETFLEEGGDKILSRGINLFCSYVHHRRVAIGGMMKGPIRSETTLRLSERETRHLDSQRPVNSFPRTRYYLTGSGADKRPLRREADHYQMLPLPMDFSLPVGCVNDDTVRVGPVVYAGKSERRWRTKKQER